MLPTSEALVIDLHSPMDAYLLHRRQTTPNFSFAGDGVHPDDAGHLLMAETVLRGLKVKIHFDKNLNEELVRVEKDPLYNLVKQQRESRSQGWLAYIGYTRGETVKTDSIDATERANETLQA